MNMNLFGEDMNLFNTPPVDVDNLFGDVGIKKIDETDKDTILKQIDKDVLSADINEMNEDDQQDFYNSKDFRKYGIDMSNFTSQYANTSANNIQEMFGLAGDTNKFSHNCFEFLDVDHECYDEMVDSSPIMQETLAEGMDLLPTFRYLHEDIFMSLYQYTAQLLPPEKMHIQSYMNRSILSKILNTPMYIALRKICRCDIFNAGVGTEILGEKVLQLLKEEMKKVKDFEKKKDELTKLIEQEDALDEIGDEMDSLVERIEELEMLDPDGNQDEIQELQNQLQTMGMSLQEARELAMQQAGQCDELVVKPDEIDSIDSTSELYSANIATGLATDLEPVTNIVKETENTIQAWGLQANTTKRVPYGVKRNVLDRIRQSPYLKKFTDVIGKFKETAIAEQAKKDKSTSVEITSVTTGGLIQNVMPSDKMNLCNDTTKKDFYKRMSENKLMVYEKESDKTKNKGPIITCIDISGSMEGYGNDCNAPIDWAKAMGISILEIAQLQKRDYACIMYDTRIAEEVIVEKTENSPEKVLTIAETTAGGGTDFKPPLEESLKLIEDSRFKQADIVFITDGQCYLNDEFMRKFRKVKEEKDFRVLGVLIDNSSRNADSLKDFCDTVTLISDISEATNSNSKINKDIFHSL